LDQEEEKRKNVKFQFLFEKLRLGHPRFGKIDIKKSEVKMPKMIGLNFLLGKI
jgi:hypothetical protein